MPQDKLALLRFLAFFYGEINPKISAYTYSLYMRSIRKDLASIRDDAFRAGALKLYDRIDDAGFRFFGSLGKDTSVLPVVKRLINYLQKPRRFQQQRTPGWSKSECCPQAVAVTRATRWGNPFKIGPGVTREEAVARFEAWLKAMPKAERKAFLAPLRGKDLMCWCPLDQPCHADVLLHWANQGKL